MPAKKSQLPHPADLAARKALAKAPPVPLSRVLEQARASQRWREGQAGLTALGPAPATPLPPSPGSSTIPFSGHALS